MKRAGVFLVAGLAILIAIGAWAVYRGRGARTPRQAPVQGKSVPAQRPAAFTSFPVNQSKRIQFHAQEPAFAEFTRQEQRNQLLDWFFHAVIADSALTADETRRALFDMPPVRFPYLEAAGSFDYGEIRSRNIGNGEIVALVPKASDVTRREHLARIADRERKNDGALPRTVSVFEYEFNDDLRGGRIVRRASVDGVKLFTAEYGYVERRIVSIADLDQLVQSIDCVSAARLDNGTPVIAGRKLALPDYGRIRVADIATLWGVEEDIHALNRAIDAFNKKWGSGSAVYSTEQQRLELEKQRVVDQRGIEVLRKKNPISNIGFSLDPVAGHPYQRARYDGNLAGTEVGMVAFYTDLTAKLWAMDFRESAPAERVEDFVSLLKLDVSPIYDKDDSEFPYTRLWFGQKSQGFQVIHDGILFERNAARIYSVSSKDGSNKEVAANASSSAFLGWWNNHYEQVARYEPQYERLNELMKWSLIVGWLESADAADRLAFLGSVPINRSLWFPDWASANTSLKFKEWQAVGFYPRSGSTPETMPLLRSKPHIARNFAFTISGGVSLESDALLAERRPIATQIPSVARRSSVDYGKAGRDALTTFDKAAIRFEPEVNRRARTSVTPTSETRLRTPSAQVFADGPFAYEHTRSEHGLAVQVGVGSRRAATLSLGKTPDGWEGIVVAHDIGVTASWGRALDEAFTPGREPAAFLAGLPEVETSLKLPGGSGVALKLRGNSQWLQIGSGIKNPDLRVGGKSRGWDMQWVDEGRMSQQLGEIDFLAVRRSEGALPKSVYLEVDRNRGPPPGFKNAPPAAVVFEGRTVQGRIVNGVFYIDVKSSGLDKRLLLNPPSFPADTATAFGLPAPEASGGLVALKGGLPRSEIQLPHFPSKAATLPDIGPSDAVYVEDKGLVPDEVSPSVLPAMPNFSFSKMDFNSAQGGVIAKLPDAVVDLSGPTPVRYKLQGPRPKAPTSAYFMRSAIPVAEAGKRK